MKFFVFPTLLLGLVSCSSTDVDRLEKDQYKITCKNQPGRCHQKARDLCNDGYLVINRVRPKNYGKDTIYMLNVKCRGKIFY